MPLTLRVRNKTTRVHPMRLKFTGATACRRTYLPASLFLYLAWIRSSLSTHVLIPPSPGTLPFPPPFRQTQRCAVLKIALDGWYLRRKLTVFI
eukprot:6170279-Pleurochrysis_carterae.AAC.3